MNECRDHPPVIYADNVLQIRIGLLGLANLQEIQPMDASVAIVLRFIEVVNAHDVNAICDLMTEDHTFVDSQGKTERSREHMRNAWRGYLEMFPDYSISVDRTLVDSDTVVVLVRSEAGTWGQEDRRHFPAPIFLPESIEELISL